MDERQLKNLLDGDIPPADENARKRALNLALAEFQVAKNEPKKSFQGFSFLPRHTDRLNGKSRRNKMNKKLVYGGMATAMVVVLAASASVFEMNSSRMGKGAASINAVQLHSSQMLREAPGGKISETYEKAMKEVNEANVERAIKEGSSSLSVPIGPSRGKVEVESLKKNDQTEARKDEGDVKASSQMQSAASSMPAPISDLAKNKMAEMPTSPPALVAQVAQDRAVANGGAIGGFIIQTEPAESDALIQQGYHDVGRDKFETFKESPMKQVKEEPVSTFSIDVDTSSYTFIRKQLNAGVMPQKDAVRVEEMVNYFDYKYALPSDKAEPFKPSVTVVPSPWNEGHKLVHIGIKGYDIAATQKPRSNLVFLIDTSGSMNEQDKLPLLKNSLKMLLDSLGPDDTVGIVTYAGSAGIALEPTKVSDKAKIIGVIDSLGAGGGTAGAEGIRTAYQLAESQKNVFERERGDSTNGTVSVNRIILATDGDFNIGITDHNELKGFVERERASGVFLSVLGFGTGNYNDQMMQDLAQNGNGVAAYIDTLSEARKVLVQEASSTLFTIAKDVKIQVEFNPAKVAEYRLVGYETRALAKEDFNNDKVDAGDIGSGHAVTAIYDITPVGQPQSVDDSRYAKTESTKADTNFGSEYGFLKIRYKLPDGDISKLITTPISSADEKPMTRIDCPANAACPVSVSDDVRFSIAVAGFGQLLKGSKYTGKLTYDDVISEALSAKGADEFGYRAEFINLVRLAKSSQGLPQTQQ